MINIAHVYPDTLDQDHNKNQPITRTYSFSLKNLVLLNCFIISDFSQAFCNEGLLGGTLLLAEEMIYEREKKIRGEQKTMP